MDWRSIKVSQLYFGGLTLNTEKSMKAVMISPDVSVIMTTYNAEAHIEESLKSVLAQDIVNLEVLCVDGRSTDGTLEIINAFIKKDPAF